MSPDDMDDVESPAIQVQPPGRRRGAISAEPIREEDIESYVKKVIDQMFVILPFEKSRTLVKAAGWVLV